MTLYGHSASSSLALGSRHSRSCGTVESRALARTSQAKLTRDEKQTAYLERKYPLRVSNDIDLASIPTAPEYVPLESVKVDAPPSSSDSPRLHRRTSSTVSAQGDDHKLVLPSQAPAVKPKLPPVDKVVLLRRIAADQVFMCDDTALPAS